MIKRLTIIMALACMLAGCGEYNKVMKSSDLEYKYDYAKRAFENKRYAQAYEGKGKRVVELVFVADDETRCIVL